VPKWAVASVLGVWVWLAYLPGNMGCSDSMWSIPTAVSLIDHRDGNLDEYQPQLAARGFFHTQKLGGHYYTESPLGPSLLAIPGVLVLRPLFGAVFRNWPSGWEWLASVQDARGCAPLAGEPIVALNSWAEHLIASAMTALAAAIIFLIAADEVSVSGAAVVALLFAFATPAWSTASRVLWQHGPSMLLLSAALLVQVRGGRLIWVGALLAFAWIVRPTNLLPLVVACGWAAFHTPETRSQPDDHRMNTRSKPGGHRKGIGFLAGAIPVLALFFAANLSTHGTWLPFYFTPGFHQGNPFVAEALAGDLISPSRGLFVFSPILVFAIGGALLKAHERRVTLLDAALAACIVGHWIVVARVSRIWWAGHSYGPRFFADLMPYFAYFLIPVVAWIERSRGRMRIAVAAAMTATAAVSVAVHAQGALDGATVAWNAYPVNVDEDPVRVWDWRRPQFLAGITFTPKPPPQVDFRSVPCSAPPAPAPPPTIDANGGNSVTLSWTPAAGHPVVYRVDVGDSPGRSNLPSHEVRDLTRPSLTVKRVPPGTYYARVVARNGCGDASPSPDVAVVVK